MEKIILDLFGGDNPVDEIIDGALKALSDRADLYIVFVGPLEKLTSLLSFHPEFDGRYEIVNCPGILTNLVNPMIAIRSGEPFTLTVGMSLLAESDAKAFVSIGSTGALIISSLIKVGLKPNATKPVLGALLPADNKGGRFLLVDCGANLVPTELDYCQNAILGSEYVKENGISSNPRVALINVGAEEGKGTPDMVSAYQHLKDSDINFVGNVEPDHIFEGLADVYVCSGLTGNALIKGLEAKGNFLISSLTETLYDGLDDNTKDLIEARVKDLERLYKYNNLGGAAILGIKKPVIKAHGKAEASTIYNCLLQALGC